MTEQEKRVHRCCFTGHKSEKINLSQKVIMSALEEEIRRAYADGFYVFISGMATAVQGIIGRADLVKYISSNYYDSCFQVRNEWMVNHSARVIAAFNGQKSGIKKYG